MRPLPQRHRRRHIRETSNQNLRAENGILRCPRQESGSGHIVKNMPKHSGITLAMALSTLLAIPAPAADKPAFPLPGRDLVGTWKVESIEIPHLPADRSVTSLSGWGEALEITSGLLPVGQIVEFRAGDGEGSVLAGDSANEPAAGENLEMRLLEPIQPGVCINRAWKFHCKPGPDDTFVPGDQAISRTMLVQPHFVPRFKERKQYWDDLATVDAARPQQALLPAGDIRRRAGEGQRLRRHGRAQAHCRPAGWPALNAAVLHRSARITVGRLRVAV